MKNLITYLSNPQEVLNFEKFFTPWPIASHVWERWERADISTLEAIAHKLRNTDPEAWIGGARRFWEVARPAEVRALCALTDEEHEILFLRPWRVEEWSPTFFGYECPTGR